MARPWSELRDKMSPESQARSKAEAERLAVADPDIPALVARLEHYARERKKLRSIDLDAIYALHSPPDPRHAELTLTDVEAAAAALWGLAVAHDDLRAALATALRERDEAREALKAIKPGPSEPAALAWNQECADVQAYYRARYGRGITGKAEPPR